MTAGARRPTVAVVGGGIAGLAAAWELARQPEPVQVVVVEAADHLGGKIRTATVGGDRVPVGPDAFVARRPEAVELCRQIELREELVAPASGGAFVWSRGRLRALPVGLALGVPTRWLALARSGILGPLGAARAGADLLAGPARAARPAADDRPDMAVGAIVSRHLGRQVTERLADPLIGGIHAGPVTAMSAAAVFAPLLAA